MAKSMEDIIREVIESHGIGADEQLNEMQTLMQDPSQMQMQDRRMPNRDMLTNPQRYDTMNPPPPRPMPYLDPVGRNEKFNDAQTGSQQRRRDEQMNQDVFQNSKIMEMNPDYQEGLDLMFPPRPSVPGVPSMNNLYDQMPEKQVPQSRMPQQDPSEFMQRSPDADFYKLMEFYTQGGQVET